MKVSMMVYGRHAPEFEVRLAWGWSPTSFAEAQERCLHNLRSTGVTPNENDWEEWAQGGFEIKEIQ